MSNMATRMVITAGTATPVIIDEALDIAIELSIIRTDDDDESKLPDESTTREDVSLFDFIGVPIIVVVVVVVVNFFLLLINDVVRVVSNNDDDDDDDDDDIVSGTNALHHTTWCCC